MCLCRPHRRLGVLLLLLLLLFFFFFLGTSRPSGSSWNSPFSRTVPIYLEQREQRRLGYSKRVFRYCLYFTSRVRKEVIIHNNMHDSIAKETD